MSLRLVVLASGNGSNLQAVVDACASGRIDGSVVAVVSDRRSALALERGRRAGATVHDVAAAGRDRPAYDQVLADVVAAHSPDVVVLAGWMRILTSVFLDRFPDRVVNLHPALPGELAGMHAIERAWEEHRQGHRDRSGVMVHLVPDEQVDAGPVLAHAVVPFEEGDTLESFEARVHAAEHETLVAVLAGWRTAVPASLSAHPPGAPT